MLTLIAALQIAATAPSIPPASLPPPPFTRTVEAASRRLAASVAIEFKRCGDARTNSNGRYVEAFGSPRHSPAWQRAGALMHDALTTCRGLRRALRDQEDFLIDIAQNGTAHDAPLAARQLDPVSSELVALERYLATETPRYLELVTVGWGNPHCAARADGFMPAASICPKGEVGSGQ